MVFTSTMVVKTSQRISSRSSSRHVFSGVSAASMIAMMLMPTATNSFSIQHAAQMIEISSNKKTIQKRSVHLPKRNSFHLSSTADDVTNNNSVTGPIYEMDNNNNNNNNNDGKPIPKIQLFTKEGCTLCDKVKDTLSTIKTDYPHSLYAIDITDKDKLTWYNKYKYDIPVLHMNNVYWTKHRLTPEEAIEAIEEVRNSEDGVSFTMRTGEPDAGRLEH